ncbi:MAG: hypothetical protein LBV47_03640 [Bacteroidales bacterium]|nr:hypothetical protein [Bacteroidales bacterium]
MGESKNNPEIICEFTYTHIPLQSYQEFFMVFCKLFIVVSFSAGSRPDATAGPDNSYRLLIESCPAAAVRSNKNDDFPPCRSSATTKTMIFPFAEARQAPKRRFYPLPKLGKHQKDDFTSCRNSASTKKTILPFAETRQTQK